MFVGQLRRKLSSLVASNEGGTNTILDILKGRGLLASTTSVEPPVPGCAFYIGFDPTAPSLHLGNLLGFMASDLLSKAGFRPIVLLGGATARVGDPSFREHAKTRLDDSVIEHNVDRLRRQLTALFPEAIIVDNYVWQGRLNLLEFLDKVGSGMRLSSMLGRESVQRRLESTGGMSFTEFTYQLLQAYDFLHLLREHNCRLQLGGSDQWGNIVAGVELIRRLLPAEDVMGLTFPLLTTSGGGKMGKSDGNALWLDATLTSPFDMYQYVLRLADPDALRFLPMLTRRSLEDIADIRAEHERQPERRRAQQTLAHDIVTFVHGTRAAEEAVKATRLLFDEYESVFAEIESIRLVANVLSTSGRTLIMGDTDSDCTILQVLKQLLPEHSNNALRTLHKSGGIYINGRRSEDLHAPLPMLLEANGSTLIRIGKQQHFLVQRRMAADHLKENQLR